MATSHWSPADGRSTDLPGRVPRRLPTSVTTQWVSLPVGFTEEQKERTSGLSGQDALSTCLSSAASRAASGQGLDTFLADVANNQCIRAKRGVFTSLEPVASCLRLC